MDTSSWIVFDQYYPKYIFGVLWTRLQQLVKDGHVQSPEQVKVEIKTGKNDLYNLVRKNKNMFQENETDTIKLTHMIESDHPHISHTRERQSADLFIIALALKISKTGLDDPVIVTEEKPTKRWSIPFVAKQYNLKSIKLLDLFDQQKWHFNKE